MGAIGSPARRLVVGVSGSSAPQLAQMFLRVVRDLGGIETHLVISDGARRSIMLEMGRRAGELEELADVVHNARNMGAAIASGSFLTMGMVVIPCSMSTLGAVAGGISPNLLTRAVDVNLKERRRVVLVTRETPLSYVHIKNMETVTLAGATVLPPVPAFYHRPRSIDDLLLHVCGKVLDQFGVEHDTFTRWGSSAAAREA